MKRSIKIIIVCVSITVLIAVVAGLVQWAVYSFSPPNKNKAEKVFKADRKLLETVVLYLENTDYESVSIHKTMESGKMAVNVMQIKIEDETAVKAMNKLFKRGYDAIVKDGNTIHFQRWARLMDFGSGLAYSINGEDEPVLQYLTKLEPLSENGWYYYEEDYNEWRLQ